MVNSPANLYSAVALAKRCKSIVPRRRMGSITTLIVPPPISGRSGGQWRDDGFLPAVAPVSVLPSRIDEHYEPLVAIFGCGRLRRRRFRSCDIDLGIGNFPGGVYGRSVWRAISGEAK